MLNIVKCFRLRKIVDISKIITNFNLNKYLMRVGRKSASQTPAPSKERIYGSKKNPKGSAASKTSAIGIKLSDSILTTLEKKRDEFNEKHPNKKVTLTTLKAVMRRGMGAYSSSHRPTITGGAPNTRQAWAFARVNKFLLKKGGTKVKAAYVQDDDLMAKGGEIELLAPNGKKSNLTPEQYKLVRTPQFKAWFGDWENDPENASKVVDENGEPKVVYHGTKNGGFSIFDVDKVGENTHNADIGFFFIDTYSGARSYSGSNTKNIIQDEPISMNYTVFLNIRNPKYIFWGNGKYQNSWNAKVGEYNGVKEFIASAYNEKYDGAIIDGVNDTGDEDCYYDCGNTDYIAFNSNQIKLADSSNTTFDANNPDIRYEDGGMTDKNEKILKFLEIETPILNDKLLKTDSLPTLEITKSSEASVAMESEIGGDVGVIDKKLRSIPIQEYDVVDNRRSNQIAEQIEENGFIEPLIVSYNKYGAYIVEGQHRAGALKKLGYDKAPVIVIYNPKELLMKNINYEDGGLIAPNGKKSNLTSEQYKLVRTPQFKAWFGDWENDPENASKVVDLNGEPLVMFRGNKEHMGYEFTLGHNLLKKPTINNFGHFFTPDLYMAKKYAEDFMQNSQGYILEVFLDAKTILDLTELGSFSIGYEFVDYLESKGLDFKNYKKLKERIQKYLFYEHHHQPNIYGFFDLFPKLRNFFIDNNVSGIKFLEESRGGGVTYVVFNSNQIKLGDGSNTTFDANNPDIRYEDGGVSNMEITCHNCKWHWNTDESEKFDKYVCHKCGFDNKEYYMEKSFKDGGNLFADKYPKNQYVQLTKDEVDAYKDDIFNMINSSYAYIGGHIEFKNPEDVINSDLNFWIGADVDSDPEVDTIIAGKKTNYGIKITTSAQDGGRDAKISVSKKMIDLMQQRGFYAETNLDLAEKRGLKWETDENIIRKVVNKPDIVMNEDGSYVRKIGGEPHKKVLVGYFDHIKENKMKKGGEINPDNASVKRAAVQNSGATGGLLVGNRHSEGGIKAFNKSSGTPLEMEGGEVVITRDAVSDESKREFEGEMLTNRQILSKINQSGGGISFADGGEVPEKCSCSGKTYKYGGKVMSDYDIATYINGDNRSRRNVLESYYASIKESIGFEKGGEITGLEDLGDCARSFLVDIKNSGKQFMDIASNKKHEIKELEDNDFIYTTNSNNFGCLTAFLTSKGRKFMSAIPTHLFKKGGMTSDCGCSSYAEGGDLAEVETLHFKGVDHDYENQFELNKAIEELLDMKDDSELTVEEKNFLTYFSGYGGLEKFGASGKGLLYEYFTPSIIAKKMWALAYKHGFEDGMVLEPSCGIGEFIKYAPQQEMVTGFEINPMSAKIARILYPEANIEEHPFEKIFIKNNYSIKGATKGMDKYSLVIGNPPYGSMGGLYAGMGEKEYARANNYIDYFILRGLDLVQSGGLLIYIIGTEVAAGGKPFLQQGVTENKKLIAERAELVDAYRLPNGVFERTDVLTDIVVFKKK